MTIPSSTLEILDGNLGAVPSDISRQQAAVGVCSSGEVNTVYSFASINALRDTLGDGPLVEYAAYVLSVAGGPILCVRIDTSDTGSVSSVTKTGTGTSTMATSGSAPKDSYDVIAKIVTGAVVSSGDATAKISLDGGYSYGPEVSIPASGVYTLSECGLTLTFSTSASATVVAGTTYAFTTGAPTYTTSELSDAIDALPAENAQFFAVQIVGVPEDGTAAAAVAAAVDSKMVTLQNGKDFAFAFMSAHDDTRANVKADLASFASNVTNVSFSFCQVISPINQRAARRPVSWVAGARASRVEMSEDLAAVKRGALVGVVSIESDEAQYGDMDTAGFTTVRTHKGKAGFYLTNSRQKCDPSSDFRYTQHRRVMDAGAHAVSVGQLKYLNDKILVSKTSGLIDDVQADQIDADLSMLLQSVLVHPGHATDAVAAVDRTENILSTETLHIDYAITPYGYGKQIVGRIGFTNPAIQKA